MKTTFLFLLFYLLLSIVIIPQDDKTREAESLLNKYSELNQINGTVLIAEKDQVLLLRAYGFAEFDAREKNS
jgi:hypothetical protein